MADKIPEALHVNSLVPKGLKICQWRENDFWEKSPVDEYVFFFIFTQKFKISHRSRDKSVQHGRQKWQESNIFEMLPVHSADSLRVKNFIKITLSLPFPR